MNALTNTENAAVAAAEPSHVSASALMMNPESLDRVMRIAEMMANGRTTIPAHLQKNPADCMAVVLQSMQWGMLPHIVAQKTHIVNGTLGYEAQLVNAVVQASGAISGRFHYEYRGKSPTLECRVGAVIRGEQEITWNEWLNEAKVTTKNSPLWKTNPTQQMGYLQVKNWARAHTPGALLGVYTDDELRDIPAPRNIGPNTAPAEPETAGADLQASARAAAAKGKASFAAFFNALPKEVRPHLRNLRQELDATAAAFDASRTVEPASKTSQETGEITMTFEEVVSMLAKATNGDALDVAMDWANVMEDKSRMPEINEFFNTRLAAIRGE